jgi:hypothetical protein
LVNARPIHDVFSKSTAEVPAHLKVIEWTPNPWWDLLAVGIEKRLWATNNKSIWRPGGVFQFQRPGGAMKT